MANFQGRIGLVSRHRDPNTAPPRGGGVLCVGTPWHTAPGWQNKILNQAPSSAAPRRPAVRTTHHRGGRPHEGENLRRQQALDWLRRDHLCPGPGDFMAYPPPPNTNISDQLLTFWCPKIGPRGCLYFRVAYIWNLIFFFSCNDILMKIPS